MQIIIFNVQHGFCSFISSPNKYGLLIDCGARDDFSPIKYIRQHFNSQKQNINYYFPHDGKGYRIAKFVLTHPHADHLEDIPELIKPENEPGVIRRCKYILSKIRDKKISQEVSERIKKQYENIQTYLSWSAKFTEDANNPDWGFIGGLKHFSLCQKDVDEISTTDNEYINNSSIVTILEHKNIKVLFPGDIQVSGWQRLLKNEDFVKKAKDLNFFIASHHGHKNGFTKEIIDMIGKPDLFIIPARSKDDEVDSSYSKSDISRGLILEGESTKSYSISTKDLDKSIFIDIEDSGNVKVKAISLNKNVDKYQQTTRNKIRERRLKKYI